MNEGRSRLGAFREVPFMGVIFVVHEAMKRGFVNGHPDWSNLGQGQPEVGPMDGAPERIEAVRLDPADHAYGPLEGIPEPDRADQETRALREVFSRKRNEMLSRLKSMGVRFAHEPRGTFYCWGSLDALAPPFDDAMSFFWRALDSKVMTVPGAIFDVNPGKRRKGASPTRSGCASPSARRWTTCGWASRGSKRGSAGD